MHRYSIALRRIARHLLLVILTVALLEPALVATRAPLLAQGRKPASQKKSAPAKKTEKKSAGKNEKKSASKSPAKGSTATKKTVAAKSAKSSSKSEKSASAKTASGKTASAKTASGKTASAKTASGKTASGKTASARESRRARVKAETATSRAAKGTTKRTREVADKTPKQPAPPKRLAIPVEEQILPDTTYVEELADGIAHRWVRTNNRQIVNVVSIDLKAGARLKSFKALERCDGLQNACDIGKMALGAGPDTVIAATNASFWRAGSNTPIGATVTGGEVVELPGYKLWSSLLVFDDGTAAIDRISLRGEIFWRSRHFSVAGVNRRGDAGGVVVYNGFYGDSLPRGSRKSDSAIIAEAAANRVDASTDDTEGNGIDTAAVIRGYRQARLLEDREHPILKIACVPVKPRRKRDPLPPPVVGDTMRLIVTAIDTGVVEMPEHGYVISLGDAAEWFQVVQRGDTIGLLYSIYPAQPKRVRDILTGTPRLVRDGRADPEYEVEGSKARRFIDGKLARTAVGISRDGDTLLLATVNSPNPSESTTGMTLAQLAAFMRSIGAYQAMNFDGGGSASMALNGVMVSRQGDHPTTRRVSNALLAVKPLAKPARPQRRAKAVEATGTE